MPTPPERGEVFRDPSAEHFPIELEGLGISSSPVALRERPRGSAPHQGRWTLESQPNI